jgi:DNA-binding transcriptional ArsR family regulator
MPDDGEQDAVFRARANATRRRILDILRERPGANVNEVCAHFETSRIAVMKHLGVLEDAALVVSRREGRSRRLYFNTVPIQMIYDRWTTEYSSLWARRLTDLKYRVETGDEDG